MSFLDSSANITDLTVAVDRSEGSPVQNAATLAPDSDISRWYSPGAGEFSDDILPAHDAYQSALRFCKQDLQKVKASKIWLDSHNNITSVLKAVDDAKARHEVAKSKRSGLSRKATSVWDGLSAKLLHYQTVMDVLIQGFPDYVSLAWGAIKFLFVVTVNHKELAQKIAQSFSTIGDLLEPVHITEILYPVSSIKRAVAHLYALIMHFCIRATEWYQKNSLTRLISSVASPWSLEFGDIVLKIKEQSQFINMRAVAASHAEIRVMHNSIQQHLTNQQHIWNLRQAQNPLPQCAPPQWPLVMPSVQSAGLSIEFILRSLPPANVNPEEDLKLGTALRSRRRLRSSVDLSPLCLSENFKNWVTSPTSSILHINSSILARDDAKDFAIEIVKFAQSSGTPIVWAINPTKRGQMQNTPVRAIISSLLQQIIRQHSEMASHIEGLHEQHIRDDMSIQDLMDVFHKVVSHFPRILIVLNISEQFIAGTNELEPFWAMFKEGGLKAGSMVKLLIVTHVLGTSPSPSHLASRDGSSMFYISLHKDRRDEERFIINGRKAPPVPQRRRNTWEPEQIRPLLGDFFKRP